MELYILDKDYDRVGYIDHADSILWNKKYNDVGECEIYLPCSIEMLALLQKGNYVYREDDDMFCKIDRVRIETDVENGDYIVATASDISSILAGRIVTTTITYTGTVAGFIKKIINDNVTNPTQKQREIKNFVFDDSNFAEFTETISVNAFTEDLLELIKTTCKTYKYGFRIKYQLESKSLKFGLVKGKNKATTQSETYVEFSPTYSNILTSKYEEDDSNYKNVCYIGYKKSDDTLAIKKVTNQTPEPEGEERREIYVDGSGVSKEVTLEELQQMFPNSLRLVGAEYYSNDKHVASVEKEKITVTDETYELILEVLGYNTLAERTKTKEFDGSVDIIDTYVYKEDYDVGDIVKVTNEYGLGAEARIVEVMESEDNDDGYQIEPKFEYIN